MFSKVVRNNIALALGSKEYRQARIFEIVCGTALGCTLGWVGAWLWFTFFVNR